MPPPCKHPNPEETQSSCSFCRVYMTHAEYRAQWDKVSFFAPKKWPLSVRILSKFRTEEDKGVGDTLARLIRGVGGEVYKKLYKRILGKDCGCGDRQAKMNKLYPYDT